MTIEASMSKRLPAIENFIDHAHKLQYNYRDVNHLDTVILKKSIQVNRFTTVAFRSRSCPTVDVGWSDTATSDLYVNTSNLFQSD